MNKRPFRQLRNTALFFIIVPIIGLVVWFWQPRQSFVSIERTGCRGTCPVYQLTVWKNGRISYTGENHVHLIGEHKARISKELAHQLFADLEAVGVYELDDYTKRQATSHSFATVTIWDQGKFNRIEHYLGDFSAPRNVFTVELLISESVRELDLIAERTETVAGEVEIILSTEPAGCGFNLLLFCYRYKLTENAIWKKIDPELLSGLPLEENFEYLLTVEITHVHLSPNGNSYDELRVVEIIEKTAVP